MLLGSTPTTLNSTGQPGAQTAIGIKEANSIPATTTPNSYVNNGVRTRSTKEQVLAIASQAASSKGYLLSLPPHPVPFTTRPELQRYFETGGDPGKGGLGLLFRHDFGATPPELAFPVLFV